MAPKKKSAGDTLQQLRQAKTLIEKRYSAKFSAPFWQKTVERGYPRNRIVSYIISNNIYLYCMLCK